MTTRPIALTDQNGAEIAVLDVAPVGDLYRGTIGLDATPQAIRRLFEEFEEFVEGQMFPLADEMEEKIAQLRLKVVFAGGVEACAEDLQVYPSTKRVSFKVRKAAKEETIVACSTSST